jgi:hypothetical protein
MLPNPCCCTEDCWIYRDTFNRPNDTDLGAAWTEDEGDWFIEDNTLTTSDSDAFCYYDTALNDAAYLMPFVVAGMTVQVNIKTANDGNVAGIYLELVGGGSLAVEIEFGATAKARIFKGVTMVAECNCTAPVDTWVTLRFDLHAETANRASVLIDGEPIAIRYSGGDAVQTDTIGPYTGTIAGDVFFDDFTVYENDTYIDGPIKPDCVKETIECIYPFVNQSDMPPSLAAVVVNMGFDGVVNRDALNGTHFLDKIDGECDYELEVNIPLAPPYEDYYYDLLSFFFDSPQSLVENKTVFRFQANLQHPTDARPPDIFYGNLEAGACDDPISFPPRLIPPGSVTVSV